MNNFLLIEHGGARKQFILTALRAKGPTVYLACSKAPDWAGDYLPKENLIITDTQHPTKLVADVVAFMEANNVVFKAVGTFYEQVVTQTAVLARALGLIGTDPGAAFRSSCNKLLMRRYCRQVGIPTPKLTIIDDLSEQTLENAVDRVGVPCVIKPISSQGSYGALKIEANSNLRAVIEEVKGDLQVKREEAFQNFTGKFLIEEYLSGPVVSVDGIVQNGNIMIAGLSEFLMSPEPRLQQETSLTPAIVDAIVEESCIAMAKRIVTTLGIDNCGFHCEQRITSQGPVLIEIAARLPGGVMQLGYKNALGIDLTSLLIDVWLGKKIVMKPSIKNFVLEKAVLPKKQGTVIAVSGTEEVNELPFVWHFQQGVHVGEKTVIYPDFPKPLYHYAIVAPTKQILEQRADQVEQLVKYGIQ